jgi:hypothetical protein
LAEKSGNASGNWTGAEMIKNGRGTPQNGGENAKRIGKNEEIGKSAK